MRPLLASFAILLGVGLLCFAAAPPSKLTRADDQLDYLFLGSDRPVRIRLHVRVGDKPYDAPWNEFMDKLFARFDKDGDGSLSPDEVARLPIPTVLNYASQRADGSFSQTVPFAVIDADKDGKVSKEEFRAYYRNDDFAAFSFKLRTSYANQTKQLNDAIVERLDPKGDGKLTAAKVAGMYEKFRSLDVNDDEMISQDELTRGGSGKSLAPVVEKSLRVIEPGRTDSLVKALLTKYDRNKDGKLSRKEIGLSETAFARLDADEDGSLGPAELTAYLASDEPDFVFRLQLGKPTAGKGILARMGYGTVIPLGPRLTLLDDKTIDPTMKKNYHRNPGDSLAIQLGDTKMSLQIFQGMEPYGPSRNPMKETSLQLYNQKAGKKDHVTRADLADSLYLLSIFAQADKNADGKLTRAELIEWADFLSTARDATRTLNCNDFGRSLFDVLDADGDGRLSLREMRTAWKRLAPLAKGGAVGYDDLPRRMRIDISTDGGQAFVSGSVAGGAIGLRGVPKKSRAAPPLWFRKMDKNDDGDVSRTEWLGTDEDFKAIDADGDGLISVAEAIAFETKKKSKE